LIFFSINFFYNKKRGKNGILNAPLVVVVVGMHGGISGTTIQGTVRMDNMNRAS